MRGQWYNYGVMRSVTGKKERTWLGIFRWPSFLAINLAILFLVGISTLRESYRGWTVDREIRALEAQAESLEGKKFKLIELTDTLMTPEEIEIEARHRLGWKKEGERVVVLSGWESSSTWIGEKASLVSLADTVRPKTNPERWLNYFFKQ